MAILEVLCAAIAHQMTAGQHIDGSTGQAAETRPIADDGVHATFLRRQPQVFWPFALSGGLGHRKDVVQLDGYFATHGVNLSRKSRLKAAWLDFSWSFDMKLISFLVILTTKVHTPHSVDNLLTATLSHGEFFQYFFPFRHVHRDQIL